MFEPSQGDQIAWLIPAALVALIAGFLLRGKAARTDGQRAALILWGGWLLVTGLTFSFMAGIFHQYYTVALAPAVAAVVGAGAVLLRRDRQRLWVRLMLALAVGLTTATAWMLLSRSTSFLPWLRWTVLVVGVIATLAVVFPAPRKLSLVSAVAVAFVGLAGPVAYSIDTIATGHAGAIPSAGPNTRMWGHRPPGGGDAGPVGPGGMPDGRNSQSNNQVPGNGGRPTAGGRGPAANPNGAPGMPPGGAPGAQPGGGANGPGDPGQGGMMGGPSGGLLGASHPSDQVVALLERNGTDYTWTAAAVGSNSAAGFQLATELPVMPVGGFNGSDPSPTLDQFKQYVTEGKIHYFIGGNNRGPGPSSTSTSAQIAQWVQANFTATQVDGVTLYDLTASH
jgi:4-amino-4-deoxy-L-arabinose transferase-like glycosyltransferase